MDIVLVLQPLFILVKEIRLDVLVAEFEPLLEQLHDVLEDDVVVLVGLHPLGDAERLATHCALHYFLGDVLPMRSVPNFIRAMVKFFLDPQGLIEVLIVNMKQLFPGVGALLLIFRSTIRW